MFNNTLIYYCYLSLVIYFFLIQYFSSFMLQYLYFGMRDNLRQIIVFSICFHRLIPQFIALHLTLILEAISF